MDDLGGSNVANTLEPAVLLLSGQHVVFKAAPEAPLYELSRDVTAIPQKNSSIIFERIEDVQTAQAGENGPKKQQKRHNLYLAHPAGAEFQTDTPDYYITSVSRGGTLGNIGLRSTKPFLKKPEFEAVLSAARTAADKPLSDESPGVVFGIRSKMLTERYTWVDADGSQVTAEEQNGSQRTLDIMVPMRREVRDALVATWCLKVWHDTAESPRAKKDDKAHLCSFERYATLQPITDLNDSAMERLTPAEELLCFGNMSKAGKRVGAPGSLAGAG